MVVPADEALTMFNAYVSNLSTSVGWGGQGGSMQLTLVEDPDNGKVIPKDGNGIPFQGTDPKSPKVGSACYFKYGEFYFGGVFQRWSYSEDNSSGRIYTVVLESPSKLMDGVQVISGGFNGMTDYYNSAIWNAGYYSTNIQSGGSPAAVMTYANIKNIYNAFGFYENTVDGNFGSSKINEAGMPANAIVTALDYLAKRYADMLDPVTGEPYINYSGGPITFEETEYTLVLDSLKDRIDSVWGGVSFLGFVDGKKVWNIPECYRISTENLSINNFVNEMAEVLQFDYYYEVRHHDFDENAPVDGQYENGGGVITDADIVIRTVNKGFAPTRHAIQNYITEQKTESGALYGTLSNYNVGEEFQNAVTQKAVIGGPRTRYNWISGLAAYPIWGIDPSQSNSFTGGQYTTWESAASHFGGGATSDKSNLAGVVPIPIPSDSSLRSVYNGPYYYARNFEIRIARAGRDSWDAYKTLESASGNEPNGYNIPWNTPWYSRFDASKPVLEGLIAAAGRGFTGNITALDTSKSKSENGLRSDQHQLADATFALVEDVANNFYCKKFMVPIQVDLLDAWAGNNLVYMPPGEFQLKYAWETTGGAFLENKLCRSFEFFDESGRQQAVTGWGADRRFDYSGLGSSWSIGTGAATLQIVSNAGGPQDKQFLRGGGTAWVVYDTSNHVENYDSITTPAWGLTVLAKFFYGLDISPYAYITDSKEDLEIAIPPDVVLPRNLGIPQVSNRFKYGPWIGGVSLKGKAEILSDDNLKPEIFGGYTGLSTVGVAYSLMGSNEMAPVETGSMKVAGAPAGNIGQRFSQVGPYITNMDISVNTGGVTTTYRFNTWTASFGKLAKYNIDRIAQIRSNLFTAVKEAVGMRERAKPALPKIQQKKIDLHRNKRYSQQAGKGAMVGTIYYQPGGADAGNDMNKSAQYSSTSTTPVEGDANAGNNSNLTSITPVSEGSDSGGGGGSGGDSGSSTPIQPIYPT